MDDKKNNIDPARLMVSTTATTLRGDKELSQSSSIVERRKTAGSVEEAQTRLIT